MRIRKRRAQRTRFVHTDVEAQSDADASICIAQLSVRIRARTEQPLVMLDELGLGSDIP